MIYVVKSCTGEWEDYNETIEAITSNHRVAKDICKGAKVEAKELKKEIHDQLDRLDEIERKVRTRYGDKADEILEQNEEFIDLKYEYISNVDYLPDAGRCIIESYSGEVAHSFVSDTAKNFLKKVRKRA